MNNILTDIIGREWYNYISYNTVNSLKNTIDSLYNSGVEVIPPIKECLFPLKYSLPENIKTIIMCKEPYKNISMNYRNVATGFPINTSDNSITPTFIIFKNLLMKLYNNDPNYNSIIQPNNIFNIYLINNILLLNTIPTYHKCKDARYKLTNSHRYVWHSFMINFIDDMIIKGKNIIFLGLESRSLIKYLTNSLSDNKEFDFPTESNMNEFINFMYNIFIQ